VTRYTEHFAQLDGTDAEWLEPVRRAALESFERFGFPTPKNEDWHFTNPAPIAEAEFRPMAPATVAARDERLAPLLDELPDAPRLVFVNGHYSPALSTAADLGPGVRVMSLASAIREEPSLVERYLAKLVHLDDPALVFHALNTALLHDGALLHVAGGTVVQRPIHLLFLSDPQAAGGVCHPRNLLVLERTASATVIEQYATIGGDRYFTNAVTEAWLADGALLTHYRLQREAEGAFHVGSLAVSQGRDSHLYSFSFATGAALSRTNIFTTLDGEGCGATLNGLYMLDGAQHCDHQTRIEHAQPNCYSRELYKGVLDGTAHGVFNGKVYVHPIAQKTDGKQTNNTLLLSERARIDTKPQLEIFADDVKCTHGATVGRIDDAALFYMKSRGIPDGEARRLLTYAFAAEVLETITLEPLREALERRTLARFTGVAVESA
jgi:Fe-S cluster assembly protein SufD